MTIKEIKDFIEKNNLPLDAEVRIQRIEDYYFDEGGWRTIKKKAYRIINRKL